MTQTHTGYQMKIPRRNFLQMSLGGAMVASTFGCNQAARAAATVIVKIPWDKVVSITKSALVQVAEDILVEVVAKVIEEAGEVVKEALVELTKEQIQKIRDGARIVLESKDNQTFSMSETMRNSINWAHHSGFGTPSYNNNGMP